jgi:hypothetical protein
MAVREQSDLTVIDSAGNVQAGVTVTYTDRSTGGAATIYATEAAGSPLAGNTAVTDSEGRPVSGVGQEAIWHPSPGRWRATWPGQAHPYDFNTGDPDSASRLLVATKGDLLVASADDVVAVLAAGADYKVLRARAGATLGVEYDSPVEKRTTLPGSPYEGQIISYLADATNHVRWLLQYDSATGKWEFNGGAPLYEEVAASASTASLTYAALAGSAGPAIALPLAGDYMVSQGAQIYDATATAQVFMSYDIGGTGAVDADAVRHIEGSGGNTNLEALSRMRRKAALTAVTLTSKYRVTAGTGSFENRWMSVLPIRVG